MDRLDKKEFDQIVNTTGEWCVFLVYTQICIPYHGTIYGQRKLAMIW